mgnify:CR=1 FL=1
MVSNCNLGISRVSMFSLHWWGNFLYHNPGNRAPSCIGIGIWGVLIHAIPNIQPHSNGSLGNSLTVPPNVGRFVPVVVSLTVIRSNVSNAINCRTAFWSVKREKPASAAIQTTSHSVVSVEFDFQNCVARVFIEGTFLKNIRDSVRKGIYLFYTTALNHLSYVRLGYFFFFYNWVVFLR